MKTDKEELKKYIDECITEALSGKVMHKGYTNWRANTEMNELIVLLPFIIGYGLGNIANFIILFI